MRRPSATPAIAATRAAPMSLSRLNASDRQAVSAATLGAVLLIAQQVAARAVRDALFLSAFQVKSLPLVMGASAIAALAGAEVLSLGLSPPLARRASSRPRPALSAAPPRRLVGDRPRLAAGRGRAPLPARRRLRRGARLRLLVDGQRAVRPLHRAQGGRADRRRAPRPAGSPAGFLVWVASRALPPRAAVLLLLALTATAAVVLHARAGEGPRASRRRRPGRPAPGPAPPRAQPLRAQHRARGPPRRRRRGARGLPVQGPGRGRASRRGRRSSGPSAPSTACMSVVSLLLQAVASRAALRHLGIAGTVGAAPRPHRGELDPRGRRPRLRHRHLRPRGARVAHELALPLRLRAALHARCPRPRSAA